MTHEAVAVLELSTGPLEQRLQLRPEAMQVLGNLGLAGPEAGHLDGCQDPEGGDRSPFNSRLPRIEQKS